MLHLRKRLLPLVSTRPFPFPSETLPLAPPHRRLSTAAPASPEPFAVEEYLVASCGLTRAQALKASKKLSHLKSPTRPDAVLSFLSALGLSRPDIAAVVAADPQFLCASVEKTLAPRVTELRDLGFSRSQIARLVPVARTAFRSKSLGRNVGFWVHSIGSVEKTLETLKAIKSVTVLGCDTEKVIKPNTTLLQLYGIDVCDFPGTWIPLVITRPPRLVQDAVARVIKLGLPQDSPMFRYALMVFAVQSQEKINEKIRTLEVLGWSQDDVLKAARKMPPLLNMSAERLQRNVNFLTRDVGLEISYIARRPSLVMYSLERRLLPRHCLFKVLKVNGLPDAKYDFYSAVTLSEEKFQERYLHPYKDMVPDLAATYVSSCGGKV